ncbi:hypothetical protein SPI_03857 [Niveomyces insectorum RCEF 264]|uniref:Uncharacterized protein n=1 Tax=Niveomyces insectorum RCEF 264 TaxID=1081102 RepID=A0A167WES0_9HYPO|nr:hypothetical protein SPI_03857 [Niveomyces insectorum RCEF 264]
MEPPEPSRASRARQSRIWRECMRDLILTTKILLRKLAGCRRPGQWVLHHEDLYHPSYDTCPTSRNPDSEMPVRLAFDDSSLDDKGLVWAGPGTTPDFTDPGYWREKVRDLEDKLQRVKEGLVTPAFTAQELEVLESLEHREGHVFKLDRDNQIQNVQRAKNGTFARLFQLAAAGRPGQWVLHQEDLYHPMINTRLPPAKKDDPCIRGFVFEKPLRVVPELFWRGAGSVPDFAVEDDADDFWVKKNRALGRLEGAVQEGRVQPNFTPEEEQALQALESEEGHFFEKSKHRREKRGNEWMAPRALTPAEHAAAKELATARLFVWNQLHALWDIGPPGQWVLHSEELYLPELDTRGRVSGSGRAANADDGESADAHGDSACGSGGDRRRSAMHHPVTPILGLGNHPGTYGLCYDGASPSPDFNSLQYWVDKRNHLREMAEQARNGLIQHHFTPAELVRLELLDKEAAYRGNGDRGKNANSGRADPTPNAPSSGGFEIPGSTSTLGTSSSRAAATETEPAC